MVLKLNVSRVWRRSQLSMLSSIKGMLSRVFIYIAAVQTIEQRSKGTGRKSGKNQYSILKESTPYAYDLYNKPIHSLNGSEIYIWLV